VSGREVAMKGSKSHKYVKYGRRKFVKLKTFTNTEAAKKAQYQCAIQQKCLVSSLTRKSQFQKYG
jgi:hypothetical protein